MRNLLAVLAGVSLVSSVEAQSFTRDWRSEDRAVIGDFSRITAIAASSDRVYIASPAAVLIWNPQFRRWEGSFDPPTPSLLNRVFAALTDPLDNSLWLARPSGGAHSRPDIQLWDQGTVPDGVVALACDQDNPAAGLFIRTRREWQEGPRGGTGGGPGQAAARAGAAA